MIWAALAFLGIPLWLIAIALFILLRGRSAIRATPGSFTCKARATSGDAAGLPDRFSRYDLSARWVHDVLVIHGGSLFLTRTLPLGVVEMVGQPEPPNPTVDHLKRIEDPLMLRFRLDAGADIELVCTTAEVGLAQGPFATGAPAS